MSGSSEAPLEAPALKREAAEGAPAVRARFSLPLALGRMALIAPCAAWVALTYLIRVHRAGSPAVRYAVTAEYTRRIARAICRIANYQVIVDTPAPPPGTFIATNHIGYVDIIALAATAPSLFVTRAEMLRWPVVGWLLRISGQPTTERTSSSRLASTADSVRKCLEAGQSICVFLEGTSTSGDGVLKFRSSLLSAAVASGAPVAAAALRWRGTDPAIDRAEDIAFWRDEHSFFSHFWRHLGLRGYVVRIAFDTPIACTPGETDRKALAETLHARTVGMLADL
jgi:1-acyl-sn-glycerol-3-phosphate acyltransferase